MLTVVIQAGGQSLMGEDKALKHFLGRPLIERVVDRMKPIANEIIVTTNITIVGLGPGDAMQLTREAWQVLVMADEVYLRTERHPTTQSLPAELTLKSFDDLYEQAGSFDALYDKIADEVIRLGQRPHRPQRRHLELLSGPSRWVICASMTTTSAPSGSANAWRPYVKAFTQANEPVLWPTPATPTCCCICRQLRGSLPAFSGSQPASKQPFLRSHIP